MKCTKCNHILPDDSEFCQYCGNRIEESAVIPVADVAVVDEVVTASEVPGKDDVVASAGVETLQPSVQEVVPPPASENMESDEVPKVMPVSYAQETVGAVNTNSQCQSDPKSKMDVGSVPKKAPKAKKVKQPKKKYCSRCGAQIDPQSKQCTGCGKKYFKGIKFNKVAVAITLLSLAIVALIGLNLVQYLHYSGIDAEFYKAHIRIENLEVENERLEEENEGLNVKNQDLKGEVDRLTKKVFDQGLTLNQQKRNMEFMEEWEKENSEIVNFCKDHVEIISNDGTNIYHKYGCIYLDLSKGFLVYNTETAEGRGYVKCPYCHYNLN